MMLKNPCLRCEERHVHCHAECEKYKAYYNSKREYYKSNTKKKEVLWGYSSESITKKERKKRNHNKL